MPTENNQMANAVALIERGYNFLSVDEYDNAISSFNRALDLDAEKHEAYWGLLLAERQCTKKDGSELIEIGMCIDSDNNYRFACQYADENSKRILLDIAKNCAYMCHVRIIELIAQNKFRPASLRSERYAHSSFSNKRILDAHTSLLRKNAFEEMTNETPCALLTLLETYETDDTLSSLNQNKLFSKKVELMYANYMNRVLERIAADEEYISPEDLKADKEFKELEKQKLKEHTDYYSLTADLGYYAATMQHAARHYARLKTPYAYDIKYRKTLANIWTNPRNTVNNHLIGSDGKPGSVGERWLFLAKYMINSKLRNKAEPYTDLFLEFYDNAGANGIDFKVCQAAKRKFVEEEAQKATNLQKVDYLISKMPDDYFVFWRGVEIIMSDCQEVDKVTSEINKLNKSQADIIDRLVISWGGHELFDINSLAAQEYDYSFISKQRIEDAINTFHHIIEDLNHLPEEKTKKAEPYLSKALEFAGPIGDELKKKWDDIFSNYQKICNEKTEKLNEIIKAIKDFQQKVKLREDGLCIHCGGKFKLFSRKCSICGKSKDY